MAKKLLALVATVVAVVAVFSAPASAQYPPATCTVTVSTTSVVPGQTITVSGTTTETTEVIVSIEGYGTIATIPVDGEATSRSSHEGTFSGSVTIPSTLAPGNYTLVVTCGSEVQTLNITVGRPDQPTPPGPPGPPAPPGPPGDLADTGASGTGMLLRVGGALVVLGAAFALLATKRRSASA